MIDPNGPLELDDGTPVEFVKEGRLYGGAILVRLPVGKSWRREGCRRSFAVKHAFWYRKSDGVFGGRTAKTHFVLRNTFKPEDLLPDRDWS